MAASNRNGFNIDNNSDTVKLSIEAKGYHKPGKLKGDIEKIINGLTKAAPNCKALTLTLYLDNVAYEDQVALQDALLPFIVAHLKHTNTLTVLNLEGWDIKLAGKENSNNLTQQKINEHKNITLRNLGIALATNNSVANLSLADGGFNKQQFETFFVRLDALKTEPNKKLKLKSLNIAGHALTSEDGIKEIRNKAKERNMELKWLKPKNPQPVPASPILRSEPNNHSSQPEKAKQPHAPYQQWVPTNKNSSKNNPHKQDPNRPERQWSTYLKRMVGFTGLFGAFSLFGGVAGFFISAGVASKFLAVGATITLLGVSLATTIGIGLLVGVGLLLLGLIAGAAYGFYRAEKEYQESVRNHEIAKAINKSLDIQTPKLLNEVGLNTRDLNDIIASSAAVIQSASEVSKDHIAPSAAVIQSASEVMPQQRAFSNDSIGAEQLNFALFPPTTTQPAAPSAVTEELDGFILPRRLSNND